MKTTTHACAPEDILRSVLKGDEITAACGAVRVYTREVIDAIPGLIESKQARPCPDCAIAINNMDAAVTLYPSRGWLELLERVWLKQYNAPTARQTIKVTTYRSHPWGA